MNRMPNNTIILDFEHPNGKMYSKTVNVEVHYQSHAGFVEFSHYLVKTHTQHWSVEAEGETLEIALHNLSVKLKVEGNP